MKAPHWRLALPFLTAILLASACSKNGAPGASTADMQIVPGTGVGPIQFGMAMDEVKKLLGEPDKIPGTVLSYSRIGLAVVPSRSDGNVGAIMMGHSDGGVLTERFKGATKEGIRMKSTRQDVIAAQGEPETAKMMEEGLEELRYDSGKSVYQLRDGKVVHTTVRR